MAKRTPKRKSRKPKCREGWFPVEIEIGKKKTTIVCGRIPEEVAKKGKKKGRWGTYAWAALEALNVAVQALAHH